MLVYKHFYFIFYTQNEQKYCNAQTITESLVAFWLVYSHTGHGYWLPVDLLLQCIYKEENTLPWNYHLLWVCTSQLKWSKISFICQISGVVVVHENYISCQDLLTFYSFAESSHFLTDMNISFPTKNNPNKIGIQWN